MKKVYKIVVAAFVVLIPVIATAQEDTLATEKVYTFKVDNKPENTAYYSFAVFYSNDDGVFNMGDFELKSFPGVVTDLKVSPAGYACAVISEKKEKSTIQVIDIREIEKVIHKFKDKENYCAIAFSPDAKTLAAADRNSVISLYNTRDYALEKEITIDGFVCDRMELSANNYFLVASSGNSLKVYNLNDNNMRKEISFAGKINDFKFSTDDNILAVLTDDGVLTTYDTKTFIMLQKYANMGKAICCEFHSDGKYIFVVDDVNRIMVLNLINGEQRSYYSTENEGINSLEFVKNAPKKDMILYNTSGEYIFRELSELTPFFGKLLKDELNEKMEVWLKMMDGESLSQYNERVTQESRMEQIGLFENEIATRMADDLVTKSSVDVGQYDLSFNMLELNFNTMPPIFLELPIADVEDFMDGGNLEFRNALYGVTKEDGFELIYADVYNTKSNKTYVYDNLERKSMAFLESESQFVPIALIQQSNMDEIKLEEIKQDVIALAKRENIISDHTKINVHANIVADVDANGRSIMNYKIDIAYEVDKEFSAREDFAPGRFRTDQSPAAIAMISIVKTSFETTFSKYMAEGKKLVVKITGNADAMPINGRINYDGVYGEFSDEPVYKDGKLTTLSLSTRDGITQNEQLAFLRAYGVKELLEKDIPSIKTMNVEYDYYIEVLKEEGGEFRRIKLEFTFVDAI